jgi:hypothetical protein
VDLAFELRGLTAAPQRARRLSERIAAMQSVRAVVGSASDGKPLPEFCRDLLANGVDPDTPLHVFRDGRAAFGVKSLRAGQYEHSFDGILLTQENNDMRSRNGRDQDPDTPHLRTAAAPVPRGSTPAHITTGQGDDEPINASAALAALYEFCKQHDLPVDALEEIRHVAEAHEPGDAGPPRQHLVDDAAGLADETIKEVMAHLDGRLGEVALEQLEDMLRSGPNPEVDPDLEFDEQERAQLERAVEGKDRHSISDWKETFDDIDAAIKARELMPSDRRRRVARDMPPPFPGRPTPGGAPLPGRQERYGIDRKQLAADAAFFGVKKRHLKRLARVAS